MTRGLHSQEQIVQSDEVDNVLWALINTGSQSTRMYYHGNDLENFGYHGGCDVVIAPEVIKNGINSIQLIILVHEFGHAFIQQKIVGPFISKIFTPIMIFNREYSLALTFLLLFPIPNCIQMAFVCLTTLLWVIILVDEVMASYIGIQLYELSGLPKQFLGKQEKMQLTKAWLTYFFSAVMTLLLAYMFW